MARRRPTKSGIQYETRGRRPADIHSPLTRKQELFVKELVSKDGQITFREAAIMLDTLLALHIRERMSSPTQEYHRTCVML